MYNHSYGIEHPFREYESIMSVWPQVKEYLFRTLVEFIIKKIIFLESRLCT